MREEVAVGNRVSLSLKKDGGGLTGGGPDKSDSVLTRETAICLSDFVL